MALFRYCSGISQKNHEVLSLIDVKGTGSELKNLHRDLTGDQTQNSLNETSVFCFTNPFI
jgi:hypothetical protein